MGLRQAGKVDIGLVVLITCIAIGLGTIFTVLYWAETRDDKREQMKVEYVQQVRQQINDHAELKSVKSTAYIYATIVADDTDPTVGCVLAKQYDLFSVRYTKNISTGEVILCDDVYEENK